MDSNPQRRVTEPLAESASAGSTRDYHHGLSDTPQTEIRQPPISLLPERIGRYEIHRVLGDGGFATVYLAHDPHLDRPVALKVARRSEEWSEADANAFVKEARTTAKLKHRHVVTVYDTDYCEEHGVYIAMEFVDGETLSDRLRKGPLSVEQAVRIFSQVAEAIHYGHKQGVVHRDLKPSNILLESDDCAKVSDFGLAIHEDAQLSHRGEIAGTPSYMSPEQVRGESHRMDGRADIWSLGVILYESLTGKRPFAGSKRQEIYDQILHREPKPLRQFDDRIPPSLDALCQQCLSRSVSGRPATAADVSRQLQRTLASPTRRRYLMHYTLLACLPLAVALGVAWMMGRGDAPAHVVPSVQKDGMPLVGKWYNLLEKPPQALIWNGRHPLNNYAHSDELKRFSVRADGWAFFELTSNEGRNFELRTHQILENQKGLSGVFWGFHRDPNAFPEEKDTCRGIVLRRMESNVLLVRMMEFVTAKGPGGVPYIWFSNTFRSEHLSLDTEKPWTLEVEVTKGAVTRLVFQDQRINLEKWPADGAAFDDGKIGVMAANGYLVVTDVSCSFFE